MKFNPTKRRLLAAALVSFTLLVSACAPRTAPSNNPPGGAAPVASAALGTPQARATAETAEIAYHRMAIGFLQSGEYTTNALLELALPKGVKWTLDEFSGTDYRLRFTSDEVPVYAWLVTPQGVQVTTLN